MIDVLYFADKTVKQKLFARVTAAKKLTMVTVLPPHRAAQEPERLEPFATLERDFGSALDQVLVVDEGKIEGMWRDPVVDLADALYSSDAKAAYAAARGYMFVLAGEAKATVKKSNDYDDDLERLEKAVEKLSLKRAPGAAAPRAAKPKPKVTKGGAAADPDSTMEEGPPEYVLDPWSVLGLEPTASLAEAKKAWKALLTQYHPDKVSHLAPEFRALAEEKTRQIMTAWEQVQAAAREE